MKKILNEIFFGKNSIAGGLIALAVISAIGLGCFCNKDKIESLSNSGTTNSPTPSPTKAFTKADASKAEVPSDEEMQEIVKTTMLDFNDAVMVENFTEFHSKISDDWRKSTTPDKFKQGFKQFIERKVDMSAIKSEKADFTVGPKIEKKRNLSELLVEGTYNISPTVNFKLNYVAQGKDWKLSGIEVQRRREK